MFIKIPEPAASDYRGWLRLYERLSGRMATCRERTEAYFAAINGTRPWWHSCEEV